MKRKNTIKQKSPLFELISTLIIALVLAGIIRTIFFQPFWIPTGSILSIAFFEDHSLIFLIFFKARSAAFVSAILLVEPFPTAFTPDFRKTSTKKSGS